jgi:hypothetical protein
MKVGDLVRRKYPPLVGSNLGIIIQFYRRPEELAGPGPICVQWTESLELTWTIAPSLVVISEYR